MLSTHKEHVVGLFYEHLPLRQEFSKDQFISNC